MTQPNNNQFSYPQEYVNFIPANFAFLNQQTSSCDFDAMYGAPQYQQMVSQFNPYYQSVPYNNLTPFEVPNTTETQEDLDFVSDYFAAETRSHSPQLSVEPAEEPEIKKEQGVVEPGQSVVLPHDLLEQIMTVTEDNNASVLEMLRSKIKAAMQPQENGEVNATLLNGTFTYSQPFTLQQQPVLHTEVIHHDAQQSSDKKKGIQKKRRYVKSGLYTKDKSGNFIFSSSDRAKMAQEEPQPEQDENSQGTRVKRPLNAYNIFCKMHFDQVKKENPDMSINELSKLMGEKWKSMSQGQKKSYYDKVEPGQTRYKKPLNSYNLFCKKNFDALKKEFPDKSIHVLSKIIAERWKKLSESEKKIYIDEADKQKQQQQQQHNMQDIKFEPVQDIKFERDLIQEQLQDIQQQQDTQLQRFSYDAQPDYDFFNSY